MKQDQQTTEADSSECKPSRYNNSTHCMGCKVGSVVFYHPCP